MITIVKIKVSPKFTSDYLDGTVEKTVDVFEDRVNGWFLDWAEKINHPTSEYEHAGFAVLNLVLSYFEYIMIFKRGASSDGKSSKFFADGIKDVFPKFKSWNNADSKDFLDTLYKHARCGLYHAGMTREKILLLDNNHIIFFNKKDNMIYIDRHKLVPVIQEHFKNYITQLRQGDNQLIENFLKAMKL